MPDRTTSSEASFQWMGPTRVVIECSQLFQWMQFTQCSPAEDGFLVLQCSGTFDEVLEECQRIAPCVLVVSQESLERVAGSEFSARVGVGGAVRVLVVGNHLRSDQVEKLLCMGCMGFLPHDAPRSTLRKAVRAIASGEVWAERRAVSRAVKKLILRQLVQELTVREREILRLITCGLSNRAIADRLCITHETVRWHIRSLYSKIGVQDRFSAIVYGGRVLGADREAGPSAAQRPAPAGDGLHAGEFQSSGEAAPERSTSEDFGEKAV